MFVGNRLLRLAAVLILACLICASLALMPGHSVLGQGPSPGSDHVTAIHVEGADPHDLTPDQKDEVVWIGGGNRYTQAIYRAMPDFYGSGTLPWYSYKSGHPHKLLGGVYSMMSEDLVTVRGTFLFLDSSCGAGRHYRPIHYKATYDGVTAVNAYVNLRYHRIVGLMPDNDAVLAGKSKEPRRRACRWLLGPGD